MRPTLQSYYADDPPTHCLNLANTKAFFAASGLDLSPYAGVEGTNTPYKLILTDSTGKVATAWIGAADAGEALGATLVTNGDFATDIGGWTLDLGIGGGSIDWDAGTIKVTQGTSVWMSAYQAITTVAGALYKFALTLTAQSHTSNKNIRVGSAALTADIYDYYVTEGAYFGDSAPLTNTIYFTAKTTTTYIIIRDGQGATRTSNWDNALVQEVTHGPVTGVHLVSARHGSTRNWESIETGFDYNGGYGIAIVRPENLNEKTLGYGTIGFVG